jgi:hypothetical protein
LVKWSQPHYVHTRPAGASVRHSVQGAVSFRVHLHCDDFQCNERYKWDIGHVGVARCTSILARAHGNVTHIYLWKVQTCHDMSLEIYVDCVAGISGLEEGSVLCVTDKDVNLMLTYFLQPA